MRLLRFNLFFLIQQHILRSTLFISFKAIYFRSKIYCTAVAHYCPGQYKTRTADCGLRTTDYGLGIKHGLRYKTRTKHYGLGIKYGPGYKTRTEHYGLGMKHEERFYIE